jgi:hypothetical protein
MTQTADAPQTETMMPPTPGKEHAWLHQLVGDWAAESKAADPTQGDFPWVGTERIKSLGGLWIVSEGTTLCDGKTAGQSMIALGYDPAKGKFVGTWLGTMMTNLWVYEGSLDADEKALTLDCEGPSCTEPGKVAPYQDIITIIDADYWTLTARTRGDDGQWTTFMTTHYRRT